MKRFLWFLCLGLVVGLLLSGCGEGPLEPSESDIGVVLPLKDYFGLVTQGFAEYLSFYREKVYNGYHAGEDIGAIVGTPVYAIAGGRVACISELSGLGYLIALEHEGLFYIPARTEVVNGQQYAYAAK